MTVCLKSLEDFARLRGLGLMARGLGCGCMARRLVLQATAACAFFGRAPHTQKAIAHPHKRGRTHAFRATRLGNVENILPQKNMALPASVLVGLLPQSLYLRVR